ncbi:hypothetical protein ACFZA9_01325 [Streptomyces olivaceus]
MARKVGSCSTALLGTYPGHEVACWRPLPLAAPPGQPETEEAET